MKDEHERDITRLGETTDHGGKVLDAPPDLSHIGIKAALVVTWSPCRVPEVGGVFPIISTGNQHLSRHLGKR
jgi:uncharacterized Zn-binding protein involved in type VI secretion